MDHEKVALSKLNRENFEWNATLIRPQEEQSIAFARLRRVRVDRVRAMLDDVAGALGIDPVAVRRYCEADSQATNSLCRT